MKTQSIKSFKELTKIIPKGTYQPLQQPKKAAVVSYCLVDPQCALAPFIVYKTTDKDDPVLLSKMQTLRQKDKIHWIDIQRNCND